MQSAVRLGSYTYLYTFAHVQQVGKGHSAQLVSSVHLGEKGKKRLKGLGFRV